MRVVMSLLMLLCIPLQAAELVVKEPLRLLALMPQQTLDGNRVRLTPGVHQVMVRYENVIRTRNSASEGDKEVNSEPQILTLQIADESPVMLSAPELRDDAAMQQYVRQPKILVNDNAASPLLIQQKEVKLKGFVLGVDYQELLAANLAASAAAVAAPQASAPLETSTASQTESRTSVHEQQLRQQFLQASPQERRHFISWAVQQY